MKKFEIHFNPHLPLKKKKQKRNALFSFGNINTMIKVLS